MKTVNYGDKYDKTITCRLTSNQMVYLNKVSSILGCRPSDYLRMLLNANMVAYQEGVEDENKQNDKHDII